jgi:hypothetical protein
MSDNDKAKIDDGGSAFPAGVQMRDPVTLQWGDFPPQGMSLRDWFAGMAMQGEIANGGFHVEGHMGKLAANAYAQADAMLAERKRGAE